MYHIGFVLKDLYPKFDIFAKLPILAMSRWKVYVWRISSEIVPHFRLRCCFGWLSSPMFLLFKEKDLKWQKAHLIISLKLHLVYSANKTLKLFYFVKNICIDMLNYYKFFQFSNNINILQYTLLSYSVFRTEIGKYYCLYLIKYLSR